MARIRSIKPDFFTSESVGALSWGARLTFAGLWTQVDDQGRAKDNPKVFRGALWPNDEETVSSTDVARFIDEMVTHGMVCRYTVDGTTYLHVVKMRKHQSINKPSASKLPECPIHAKDANPNPPGDLPDESGNIQDESEGIPEDSGSTTGDVPEGYRGERNGREGKGKELPPPEAPPPLPLAPLAENEPNFEDFWNPWPRKVSKADAEKAWKKAVGKERASPTAIVEACKSYAERCRLVGKPKEWMPYPATWLGRKSWADDLDEVMPLAPGTAPPPADEPPPPHCGRCDPEFRRIDYGEGRIGPCPSCHPDMIRSRT